MASDSQKLSQELLADVSRSRDNDTTELDPALMLIESYHGRDYQTESLRREINLVPIDDVSEPWPVPMNRCY